MRLSRLHALLVAVCVTVLVSGCAAPPHYFPKSQVDAITREALGNSGTEGVAIATAYEFEGQSLCGTAPNNLHIGRLVFKPGPGISQLTGRGFLATPCLAAESLISASYSGTHLVATSRLSLMGEKPDDDAIVGIEIFAILDGGKRLQHIATYSRSSDGRLRRFDMPPQLIYVAADDSEERTQKVRAYVKDYYAARQRDVDEEVKRRQAERSSFLEKAGGVLGAVAQGAAVGYRDAQSQRQTPSSRGSPASPPRLTSPAAASTLPPSMAMAPAVAPTSARASPPPETPARQQSVATVVKKERVALIPTLEAIVVCTKPTGVQGTFECRSPVTVWHGHLNDMSGHRTPEEMVARLDGCSASRRLPSATHLVWGCGFGATRGEDSLDRSAGVDVQGRRTYYCYERESICRRTDP